MPNVAVQHSNGSIELMDIDNYVKGVLPYEMGSGWPVEALKAQAVAAKSYALASGRVTTTTSSQVYGPLRQPDTDAAVDAVTGSYLWYEGRIIMPFYFGNCDGRTRRPSDAGWDPSANRPYLQGVACSCGFTKRFGHGIGMCQRGAQAMANQGRTFEEILRHYYTGAQVLRVAEPGVPGPPPANANLHTVRPGDTLGKIAKQYGTTVRALQAANAGLVADPSRIEVGWRLLIPRSAVDPAEPEVYVVQPGDTVGRLAARWRCSVDEIVRTNGLPNANLIRVGQRLLRPTPH